MRPGRRRPQPPTAGPPNRRGPPPQPIPPLWTQSARRVQLCISRHAYEYMYKFPSSVRSRPTRFREYKDCQPAWPKGAACKPQTPTGLAAAAASVKCGPAVTMMGPEKGKGRRTCPWLRAAAQNAVRQEGSRWVGCAANTTLRTLSSGACAYHSGGCKTCTTL